MKEKTKSPCDGCKRLCNYTQCKVYRLWLNRCWNRYRQWPQRWNKTVKKDTSRYYRYDSPVLLQDFLQKGPCGKCPARICCGDKDSCPAYDAWVSLRWKALRRKLGLAPN